MERKQTISSLCALCGVLLGLAVIGYLLYSAWPVISRGWSSPGIAAASSISTSPRKQRQSGRAELFRPFNLKHLQIDRSQLLSGGPPKDGIPALSRPKVVPVGRLAPNRPAMRVIGVQVNGASRAYPLAILNWHEVINDTLGGKPIAVIYCPLANSATVVDRRMGGKTLEFGVSGLLLDSNVVFYDRTYHALWSQVGFKALSGPFAGRSLKHLRWEITTASNWRREHPRSSIVSFQTGYHRNYRFNPYAAYFRNNRLMFPVHPIDHRLPLKTQVIGIQIGQVTRAYPVHALMVSAKGRISDIVAGERVILTRTHKGRGYRVRKAPPDANTVSTFWFAWSAFHPNTTIFGRPHQGATSADSPQPDRSPGSHKPQHRSK